MEDVLLGVFADLLINLSAGWFGAALIIPLTINRVKMRRSLLIGNILYGIVTLLFAILLRSYL